MIQRDQPTIFKENIIAGISSVSDGNMKKKGFSELEQQKVHENRRVFLQSLNITLEQAVLVSLTYDTDDFVKYKTVSSQQAGDGMVRGIDYTADALVTNEQNVALFLPIADCVGAILYDPIQQVVMVSHLGRHSTEQFGGRKSVAYLVEKFEVDPANLLVWLSPSPGKASYPMFAFEGRSIQDVVTEQLTDIGVLPGRIEKSDVDTSLSQNYFSHSEFKKGNRESDGRFAITAMLK